MKDYYGILEVSDKASKEVIEKAYKVLAKKYHPDLYSGQAKIEADKKLKDINEAYQVLSNDFLREQYNLELQKEKDINRANIKKKQTVKVKKELEKEQEKVQVKKKNNKNVKNKNTYDTETENYKVGSFNSILYILKELFKNKPKLEKRKITKIDVISVILTIIITIIIGIILWFIPFTNGWMRELLFENPLFNWIGRLFS